MIIKSDNDFIEQIMNEQSQIDLTKEFDFDQFVGYVMRKEYIRNKITKKEKETVEIRLDSSFDSAETAVNYLKNSISRSTRPL